MMLHTGRVMLGLDVAIKAIRAEWVDPF